MKMKTYGLQEIKKELQHLNSIQLMDLCLRTVRYKKENKELIAYLLFEADDETAYIQKVNAESGFMFSQLYGQSYQVTKMLRKILRLTNKYIKFSGSKQTEIEILMNFCSNYLQYVDKRTSNKPLRLIFTRQMEKIKKAIIKLHEDLQFDYSQDYNHLLNEATEKLSWLSKDDLML